MPTFELNNAKNETRAEVTAFDAAKAAGAELNRRLREESIIAEKVYDSCRKQDCLGEPELGPARRRDDGEIVVPPGNTATATISDLRISNIIIVDKKMNLFRNGYWDVSLKYVFEYKLTMREADGTVIWVVDATSIANKSVTLFGSIGSDIVIATDLHRHSSGSHMIDANPYVLVEAKAVALNAELCYFSDGVLTVPASVSVTIGLFTIVKLFRIVQLSVQSHGFSIAPECADPLPFNPCEFFGSLAFPFDVFSPPQKPEFRAVTGLAGADGDTDSTGGTGSHGHVNTGV